MLLPFDADKALRHLDMVEDLVLAGYAATATQIVQEDTGDDGLDCEPFLHELAHAVTLKLPQPWGRDFDENVSLDIACLTTKAADHNEMITIAAEVHVLNYLGLRHKGNTLREDIENILGGNVFGMDPYDAISQIEHRLVPTKAAKRRAQQMLRAVEKMYAKLKTSRSL